MTHAAHALAQPPTALDFFRPLPTSTLAALGQRGRRRRHVLARTAQKHTPEHIHVAVGAAHRVVRGFLGSRRHSDLPSAAFLDFRERQRGTSPGDW